MPSNATSLVSGAQITSGRNHSTAASGSAATNYATCFSSRRHRRKHCLSNSKAEKGTQLPETEITHHGVAACHSQNFIKLALVNTDTRKRLGMTFGENSGTCTHVFHSKWFTVSRFHQRYIPLPILLTCTLVTSPLLTNAVYSPYDAGTLTKPHGDVSCMAGIQMDLNR